MPQGIDSVRGPDPQLLCLKGCLYLLFSAQIGYQLYPRSWRFRCSTMHAVIADLFAQLGSFDLLALESENYISDDENSIQCTFGKTVSR